MRINNWVSPVFARLERRFVRFQAGNVEDRELEINSAAFSTLLNKIQIEINPRYSISHENVPHVRPTFISRDKLASSSVEAPIYPAWELSNFVTKVMRNIVVAVEVKGLEAKVNGAFQKYISEKMRPLGKPLEKIYESRVTDLSPKMTEQVEEMLNLGHASAAAVFTLWQIRHNVVGVPDDKGTFIKDYLRPVSFKDYDGAMEAIPKYLRQEAALVVQPKARELIPSPIVIAIAVTAHALRATASDELRSLMTYNSGW
jgi:hypothetical protein